MPNNYQCFAVFYDELTENVDYQVRSDYVSDLFSQYADDVRDVLDIACGTGEMMRYLTQKGYRMAGIDLSQEMLTVAAGKCIDGARLYQADMCCFMLPETYDACLCSLDSINHLTDAEAVGKCFRCVFDALKPEGIFVFDVNTIYKHRYVLADNAFVFDEEKYFLAWDNELLDERRIRMLLDFFVYNGESYDRFSEEIIETAYAVDELKTLLFPGFEVVVVFDDLTANPPRENSERLYFVCKRKEKWEK